MKKLLIAYFLILVICAFQQSNDAFKTANGEVTIYPIAHGTLVVKWNNKSIYIDPYGGASLFKDFPHPDLLLITDIHPDHLDRQTLDGLDLKNATGVFPKAVAEKLDGLDIQNKKVLGNNESYNWEGIKIEAIPMYNLPEAEDNFHTKGRGNGYVLSIDGKRIYISGDTEDIPEMRGLKNIDIAFVCMNLPYTMDIKQAASAVLEFAPKVVYPYHYRGAEGKLSDVEQFKKLVNKENPAIDVRLRNWYPNK